MNFLEFTGSALERGRQHGEALLRPIQDRVAAMPARSDGLASLAAPWLEATRRADTAIVEELTGIADGSGCSLDEIMLLNAFEAFDADEQTELGGCTAIAVPGPRGVVVAQNWDANDSLASTLTVQAHRQPGHPTFAVLASPGGLGWIGMNDHGLAVTNCDLLTRATRVGVPSQVVRRRLLRADSVTAAATLLGSLSAVAGRAYLIGDRTGRCAAFELAAETTAPVPVAADSPMAHTNHALSPTIATHEDVDLINRGGIK